MSGEGERFAIATREELWIEGRMVESRLSHGEAFDRDDAIEATDAPVESLLEDSARELDRLRAAVPVDLAPRVRFVVDARLDGLASAVVLADGRYSVVSSAEHAGLDRELLRRAAAVPAPAGSFDYRGWPLVWTAGSGAVLLHEAAGHPAEHRHAPVLWPRWLAARDGEADLLAGDGPAVLRRASFANRPLKRMTEVRVWQDGAPFDEPSPRVEVFLIEGGSYEPLTELVTVSVAAADLVDGEGRRERLPPFEIREPRAAVARALTGAFGEPVRYPGVVCSREGQELLVASFAPLLVTVFA